MQKLTIPNYSTKELETLLNSNPDYVTGMRLMALIQIKKGMSSRQLESFYFKSHSRYCVWVKNFNIKGIDGLKNKPKSGRKPRMTKKQKGELEIVLQNNGPEEFGYNTSTWNGPIIIDYIKKKYDIEYKKAQVYNIIKSLGFSFQKGRPKYPEANEEQRKEFKRLVKKTSGRT